VAQTGVFVSAHPEAIQRLGTKDVLFETRDLPFGSDVHRIDGLAQLEAELPQRLRQGARVIKQHRGHSGIGVWRVEAAGDGALTVQHALRGSTPQCMDLATLKATLACYFEPASGGHMIDQAWQPRLPEGMVRAYMVEDRVTGFGVQAVNAMSFVLGEIVGDYSETREVARLIQALPPSLRQSQGEELNRLLVEFEAMAFAPSEALGELARVEARRERVALLKKALQRVVELSGSGERSI
jgi:hypothetical protein